MGVKGLKRALDGKSDSNLKKGCIFFLLYYVRPESSANLQYVCFPKKDLLEKPPSILVGCCR